ncbi:MAG TPA: universal stress protein [Kiloniellaceae bacterium]|nr:universal stress protein [Kiloniellaceae bacterium]
MSYATILAVIDGRGGSENVAQVSLDLGRRFKAAVTWLHVIEDPTDALVSIADGMTGAVTEQILEQMEAVENERAQKARALYDRLCRDAGIELAVPDNIPEAGRFTVAYLAKQGDEAVEVERQGRLVDLIVAARPGPDGEAASSQTFHATVMETGRPVLSLPAEGGFDLSRIAVAWDGSRESAKAVSSALPLLREAEKVEIVTAREGSKGAQPSQLQGYLAAHGVRAETWAFAPAKGSLGESILEQCERARCGLLVMGAYGHSPIREMFLGGVSRDVMKLATIPVLVTH